MCGTLLNQFTIHYYTHPWTQQTRHILLAVGWFFKSWSQQSRWSKALVALFGAGAGTLISVGLSALSLI
jgi:hypothetical protein